jgi:multidrug resistance efflux pump
MTDTQPADVQPTEPVSAAPVDPSRRGIRWVGGLILVSLLWYLLADRYTPYTQQARVQALVVPVASEITGKVTHVEVRNDQMAEAGQLLFEIDKKPFEIAVERARADLESTRRQIGAGTAGIESALASVRVAQAKEVESRQDRDRLERLYRDDPGAISLRRLEVSRAGLEQAVSQVAVAQAEVERAREQEGGSSEDNAKLRSAVATLKKAELDLANTQIRARSAGLVTDLRAEVGQFAAAGNPVLTLITVDDVWVSAEFTENNLGHLKSGTPVGIVLDALPGQVFKGRVRSIGFGVSVGSATAPGTLPTVENSRDWLRPAQRFPVIIEFIPAEDVEPRAMRVGGQAEVMAFPISGNPLNPLGRLFLRLMSWLSFAY